MTKTISLIIIVGFLSINSLIAQVKMIDTRFKGKEKKLTSFLESKLKYPEKSISNKSIGYSIASVSITPEGEISEISVINPIDEGIDKKVVRVLKKSEKHWKRVNTLTRNQTFYVQIAFSISRIYNKANIYNPVNDKYEFIGPVVISSYTFDFEELPEKMNQLQLSVMT